MGSREAVTRGSGEGKLVGWHAQGFFASLRMTIFSGSASQLPRFSASPPPRRAGGANA
jgi:hypothetical protein